MAERIGLGIVGFGIMGERLARFAADHEQVRIVGVWDPAPEAAARLAAAGWARAFMVPSSPPA